MEGNYIKIHDILRPLSWLYGFGVSIRNVLFDYGIMPHESFDVPVISVGNITVGGTGKTPHIEYLIRLLEKKYKVAVLSRGYKRKTRGYKLADLHTPMEQIGDEPFQIRQKFRDIYVAVDANRRRGIHRLCEDAATADTEVVLLDDAYQHRYVTPGINILLVDYHRLITEDALLPAGRLREPESAKERANIVIITKCPTDIKPMDFRVLTKTMNLRPYQQLFFTCLKYSKMRPIFKHDEEVSLDSIGNRPILLVTGIASPKQMLSDLGQYSKNISILEFPDHHYFNKKDIEAIRNKFCEINKNNDAFIVTTEKDTVRLMSIKDIPQDVADNLYMLPVEVEFMLDKEELFNDNIIGHVRKNSRNSILHKGKDANKS